MVQYSAHPYLHKIIHFFFTDFYKVKVKGFNFYYCYSESSPNGNPHYISRQLCARTCTNTKLCFSQLPYKLFIFIFPLAASTCYRHLFCVPMVSANENFHCTGYQLGDLLVVHSAASPNLCQESGYRYGMQSSFSKLKAT